MQAHGNTLMIKQINRWREDLEDYGCIELFCMQNASKTFKRAFAFIVNIGTKRH